MNFGITSVINVLPRINNPLRFLVHSSHRIFNCQSTLAAETNIHSALLYGVDEWRRVMRSFWWHIHRNRIYTIKCSEGKTHPPHTTSTYLGGARGVCVLALFKNTHTHRALPSVVINLPARRFSRNEFAGTL